MTHAIGEDGDDAVLLTHVLREEDIAADPLAVMVALLAVDLDEELPLHAWHLAIFRAHSFSGGTIQQWN